MGPVPGGAAGGRRVATPLRYVMRPFSLISLENFYKPSHTGHRLVVCTERSFKFCVLERVGADNVARRRRLMSRKAKNCALLADISVALEGVWVGTCSVHATRQFRNERNIHEKTAKFTFY